MADDYLSLSEDPHILIEVERDKCVSGSYQFGAQDGSIDGRFEKDCKGNPQLTFTFDGCDEMDPVSGYGTARYITTTLFLVRSMPAALPLLPWRAYVQKRWGHL